MSTTATAVTVTEIDETNPTALYCYQQQTDPQGCYITLDLDDGELTARYNPEIGNAISMREYHGVVQTWGIPCLTAHGTNQLLADLTPLAERVLAGATVDWDGSNHLGLLNDDALAASNEISEVVNDIAVLAGQGYELVTEMDAGEWWSEGDLPDELTAFTSDDALAAIVAAEEQAATTANPGSYCVLRGAEDYLAARREEMRDALRDWLEVLAAEQSKLLRLRDQMIAVATNSWGDKTRDTADRVDLSHTTVQNIAARTTVDLAELLASIPTHASDDDSGQ